MRNVILLFAISLMMSSCSGRQKPLTNAKPYDPVVPSVERITIPRDSVLTIHILSDTTQSYSIYYPLKAKKSTSAPILLCLDPHGDGRLPIDKYRKWADKYCVAIAGSNSSRNGLSPADGIQITTAMITDINSRLGFDSKNMTLCGFSGGAKVAINTLANITDITSLIYTGAVTPFTSSHPLNILGFAGNQDMNYTDLLQFDETIHATNLNSILIEFNGKHEWPDAVIFEQAFEWLTFQSWRRFPDLKDSAIIQSFKHNTNISLAAAMKQNKWAEAYQQCHVAVLFLDGISDISAYKDQMQSIANNVFYKKALAEKNATLSKEANEKSILMQAFQTQGTDWWGKVIQGYRYSTNPSDKRLLAFISLASFSYSNQALQQHNLDAAEHILAIYELADPANADQLYFHAILYADKGNNSLAIKYLKKAIADKLTDWQKIDTEPAFTQLKNDPAFDQIVVALKKGAI
jgi:hypothetical protein